MAKAFKIKENGEDMLFILKKEGTFDLDLQMYAASSSSLSAAELGLWVCSLLVLCGCF